MPDNEDRYLSTAELAERYRRSPRTIQDWRLHRAGPKHVMIRGQALYRLSDCIAWEREQEQAS